MWLNSKNKKEFSVAYGYILYVDDPQELKKQLVNYLL